MPWTVLFDDAFLREFDGLDKPVQAAITKYADALSDSGPQLGRPFADILAGSRHANMKELRPTVNKVEWRIAFAFDPKRQAVFLAALAKGGKKESLVYARLIKQADARFDAHLEKLAKQED